MATNKGFIKDWLGNYLLPITRGELVLDSQGQVALHSNDFLAGNGLPGLITAAEREMLTGGGNGQSLADVYNKLDYINNGLKVNGSSLNFYDTDGNASPINITSSGDNMIEVVPVNNVINLGLKDIHSDSLTASQILKSIKVDKYGRVTEVTGSSLTNEEIPTELSGKTLKDSTLDNCLTSTDDIGDNNKAVANKYYVDNKFKEVTNIALGALKFGGSLSSADAAITAATEDAYKDKYFKVTSTYTISSKYIYFATGETATNITVKSGDTLIRHPEEKKLVYVPSGDEVITRLTVTEDNAVPALEYAYGDVTFQFSSLFEVTNPRGLVVSISIPQANSGQDGYLSKGDYAKFSSYADSLAVSYSGNILSTTPASYLLGTLTIGSIPYELYGLNNISSLSLENGTGTDVNNNPILKFTETGTTDVKIAHKGINGIKVTKDGNDIAFAAVNEVVSASNNYLEISQGYQFGVKIGSFDGTTVTDGLTDYREFNTFLKNITTLVADLIMPIENSLSDTTKTYYYGSNALLSIVGDSAITI